MPRPVDIKIRMTKVGAPLVGAQMLYPDRRVHVSPRRAFSQHRGSVGAGRMYTLGERQGKHPFRHELHEFHEFLSPVFVPIREIRGRLAISPQLLHTPRVRNARFIR